MGQPRWWHSSQYHPINKGCPVPLYAHAGLAQLQSLSHLGYHGVGYLTYIAISVGWTEVFRLCEQAGLGWFGVDVYLSY